MPVYRYRCNACDAVFEELFLTTERAREAAPECPECNSPARRTYSGHTFASPGVASGGGLLEDGEQYREMHYHERRGDWERAASAAEGVSDYAKNAFLRKAQARAKPKPSS